MSILYGSDCSGIEAPYLALREVIAPRKIKINHLFASDIKENVRRMIIANYNVDQIFETANVAPQDKPYVDIYTSGFPCQPFSTVGLRKGFEDTRGTVFHDCAAYIEHHRPKMYLLENVKGLKSHNKGETFQTIMSTLENNIPGYHVSWHEMSPHTHCNHPQHRPRIFIVGLRNDIADQPFAGLDPIPLTVRAQDLLNTTVKGDKATLSKHELTCLEYKREKFFNKAKIDVEDDYYFVDVGSSAHYGSIFSTPNLFPTLLAHRTCYYITKLQRKLTTDEARAVQGIPPLNVVVAKGQFEMQIGNSICVPLLKRIFQTIFDETNILPK